MQKGFNKTYACKGNLFGCGKHACNVVALPFRLLVWLDVPRHRLDACALHVQLLYLVLSDTIEVLAFAHVALDRLVPHLLQLQAVVESVHHVQVVLGRHLLAELSKGRVIASLQRGGDIVI